MSNRHLFDQIVNEIKNDPIPEGHLEQARRRALSKMVQKPSDTALDAAGVEQISGCTDFQKLIPAYVKKELSEARMTLVQDHTSSCVPCRKYLHQIKESGQVKRPERVVKAPTSMPLTYVWRIAAVFILFSVVGLGYKTLDIRNWFTPAADIQIVDGDLYSLSNHQLVRHTSSEVLSYGQEIRAPRDRNAMVKMPDGTVVEVARRSIFSMERSGEDTTMNLLAGKAIIEAADQGKNHFFVQTPDCKVTVKGTVFSVNSGPKGSRVSVLEGKVHVQRGKTTSVLLPGNQFSSGESLKPVPLEREVAWSDAPSRLEPFLSSLSKAQAQFEAEILEDGTRYQSQLLPLMPSETSVYGAIPNIGGPTLNIVESIQEQLRKYPELNAAMNQKNTNPINEDFDRAIHLLGELSSYLGNEIAFGLSFQDGEVAAPLFLAEASGKAGLEAFLTTELQAIEAETGEAFLDHIVFVNDPQSETQSEDTLYIWATSPYIAASSQVAILQDLKGYMTTGSNPNFTSTEFFGTLDELYQTGVSIVFGIDVTTIVERADEKEMIEASGFADVQDFIFVKREAVFDSSFELNITFKSDRKGIASWLAEPSPMESLSFVSPDASGFVSISLIDPEFMLNDVIQVMSQSENIQTLVSQEEEDLFELIHDIAVALGGEVTVAFDGPLFPIPSWKVIAELYDGALLGETIDQILDLSNQHNDFDLVRIPSDFNGYSVFEVKSQRFGWNFYYAIIDGYLVAVPNLGLLDQTLKNRNFNLSIATSEKFLSILPANSYNEFSFLFYQDLSAISDPLSKVFPNASKEDLELMKTFQEALAPKLVYGYAEQQRIAVAATGGESILNLLMAQLLQPNAQHADFMDLLLQQPTIQ